MRKDWHCLLTPILIALKNAIRWNYSGMALWQSNGSWETPLLTLCWSHTTTLMSYPILSIWEHRSATDTENNCKQTGSQVIWWDIIIWNPSSCIHKLPAIWMWTNSTRTKICTNISHFILYNINEKTKTVPKTTLYTVKSG